MIEALQKVVQENGGAIPLASAAQIATAACPDGKNQNWAGFGGFRRLLEGVPNTGLVIDIEADALASRDAMRAGSGPVAGANGFLEDPEVADDIKDLARRLRNILDCPLVKTDAFRTCFAFLLDRVTSEDLDLNEIARDTRDRLRDAGKPMSRQNVNYILRAVQLSFASLGVPPTIEAMARGYQFSLSRACEAAGAPLSPAEMATLGRWVGAPETGPDPDPTEPEV